MTVHNFLPVIIAVFGLLSGIYTLNKTRSKHIQGDKILTINFLSLGLLNLYIGTVYTLVLVGVISAVPSAEVSIYMRPANLLQIVLPFLISWRMGV